MLKGATFRIGVSPRGEVTRFEGYKELIDKIAGHDGDIGPWHQRVQSRDCARQIRRGVELMPDPRGVRRGALHGAAEQLPCRDDVGIRKLGKDHVLSATTIDPPLGKEPQCHSVQHG